MSFSLNRFSDTLRSGRGGGDDLQVSNHRTGWVLVAQQDPPLGSHVVTPRRAYAHHGIYVGDGKVVHYAGLAYGLRRGPVEEIPLARFTAGNPAYARCDGLCKFDRREVIRRARSRLGENQYRLLSNNCEHFCEWCLFDVHRSFQVEERLAQPRRAIAVLLRCAGQLLCALQRFAFLGCHPGGFSDGIQRA